MEDPFGPWPLGWKELYRGWVTKKVKTITLIVMVLAFAACLVVQDAIMHHSFVTAWFDLRVTSWFTENVRVGACTGVIALLVAMLVHYAAFAWYAVPTRRRNRWLRKKHSATTD